MHSFQPSRGRIFFEVLCAVGIAASCGGAWMQTGASALLAAASIATLYSLVRFFDLFRRNPEVAAEPQRIEFEPAFPAESIPPRPEVQASPVAAEPRLVVDNVIEEVPPVDPPAPVEEEAPSAKASRRTKTPRKGATRAKASKSATEIAPPSAAAMDIEVPALPEVVEAAEPETFDESFHAPVAPLFEPEPFFRQQQRTMFGRKAR